VDKRTYKIGAAALSGPVKVVASGTQSPQWFVVDIGEAHHEAIEKVPGLAFSVSFGMA
jgi:hypothetical protein